MFVISGHEMWFTTIIVCFDVVAFTVASYTIALILQLPLRGQFSLFLQLHAVFCRV